MKIQKKLYLFWVHFDHSEKGDWYVMDSKVEDDGEWTFIREEIVEVDAPDEFDPRPQQIAGLRATRQKVQADAQMQINKIDGQIQSLLAIEHKESA